MIVSTAVNFVVSYISWRRRKTKGGAHFALGMIGITLWTLAAALDYPATPLPLKIFFAKAEALGYHSVSAFFALFSIIKSVTIADGNAASGGGMALAMDSPLYWV